MKRASYSLPALGLALSSTGCLDPIAAPWEASTFDNIPMPFSFDYTNDDGQACTNAISVEMEVYLDLSVALLYTDLVTCAGSPPESYSYINSVGDARVVARRSEYIIIFDSGQLSLDCLLEGREALRCVDLDGASYVFRAK